MKLITTIDLQQGLESQFRVADDGFGLIANLHIAGRQGELLVQADIEALQREEFFDALGLARDLEAFADVLRQAVKGSDS